MSLRWGILSTARIADTLLGSGLAAVAVGSRSAERAQAWAAERGIARAHGSYEALLADPEVDAVYVPLPNSLHVEWSIAALRAGKHVLCEKPMGRDPEAVARAFDVARAEGRLLAEGFMWRHHPQVAAALDAVRGGAIGDLRLVRGAFSFGLARPGDVRFQATLEGGALMDVGSYCVSAARVFTGGEPQQALGAAVTGGDGVDLAFAGTLRFEGDVLATLDVGMDRARRGAVEVVGSEGTLVLRDPWHGRAPVIEVDGEPLPGVEGADAYALMLADFEAAARGERAPLLGRDDAVGQARALAALHRAAAEGRAVDVG
ncbi:MAG TPA: Gfo/Idh/MocA family oxidoreductase [Capillimicrobium sp.]|jgi:predicted dehydrogenase